MKQIDELVQTAAEHPDDHVARRVLSDALRAHEEYELADAVESKTTGAALVRAAVDLAERAKLPLSLHVLWAAHALMPRLPQPARNPWAAPIGLAPPVELPETPPRRPWRAPWRHDEYGTWTVTGPGWTVTGLGQEGGAAGG